SSAWASSDGASRASGRVECTDSPLRATAGHRKYAGEGMETWYERLTALDALFLDLESRSVHMHVGAVAIFDGPAPAYRDLLALIASRIERVPRYRQRVMFVPLGQGRPVW